MTILIPVLHLGGSNGSIWLLGVTAGFILAVGLNRLVGGRP
jgi:hypothetical protein